MQVYQIIGPVVDTATVTETGSKPEQGLTIYDAIKVGAVTCEVQQLLGYQPTLGTEIGCFQERITSTVHGSITSIQAVYVPADDMTDPAPATTFIHLDATTVLSRALAAKAHNGVSVFGGVGQPVDGRGPVH